jgi:hypothetical protein
MTFSYKLDLPATLQAKVIPDSDGAIGIYSGDPSLFGNITYGSDKDRAAVEKAREHADKTYLVFGLPAPVIKDTAGREVGSARFVLQGQTLQVVAEGLSSLKTAFTIDPSVVVTATSDFQSGNVEDNIDFTPSGQITRGALTGGSVSAGWNTTASGSFLARYSAGVVAYNGYLYIAGGAQALTNTSCSPTTSNYCSDVNYAPINSSDGTIGTWAATTSFATARIYPALVAYNGYMYVYGGYNSGTSALSDVQYAPINPSNGSLGSWTTSSNAMALGVCRFGYAAYDGYLYATGGANVAASNCGNSSTPTNTVQFAPIEADGEVGTWTSSADTFTTARMSHETVAYNGYLYVVAGTSNGAGGFTDTQYAPILPSGDVGGWITASPVLSQNKYRFGMTVYNGYLYVVGGGGGSYTTDTQYAQINANGSIGAWQTTASITNARWGEGVVSYGGYLYMVAGTTSGGSVNDTQYAKIDPAGQTTSYSTTTSLSGTNSVVTDAGTIAYNGYLYIIGGYNGSSYITTTHYAPLSTTGTIGTWNTTAALNTASGDAGVAIYNGYMYVVGGETGTSNTFTAVVQYAAINSNGTLGTWNTTTALGNSQGNHHVAVYNGYLYILNSNGGGNTAVVQYAAINSNGTVGSWANTSSLNTARVFESLVAYGGYLYAVGGNNTSSVEYAAINSNGTLSSWTATSSMSTVRGGNDAFVANGYICAVGGDTVNSGTETATAECAPIKNDGSLDTWQANTSMAGAVHRGQITYYNGYVYSVSGKIGGSRVATSYYAAVNNGGSGVAGAGASIGNSFTNGRELLGTVAYNGYLYILGGVDSFSTYYNDVQYAAINADGTVGTWASTSSFINARGGLGAFASRGYMYILGGYDGTTYYNDVQYAPISSTGTLGTWHYTHGSTDDGTSFAAGFSNARYDFGATVYNGTVYLLGGYDGTTYYNDVQYAPINTDGTIGTWSSTASFTNGRYGLSAFAYAGYIYVLGGTDASTYYSDTQYASINSNGTIGTWAYTTPFTGGRYDSGVVAYDGNVYLLGGRNSSTTYLSDTQYAPINSNGSVGNWASTTILESTTAQLSVVAYGGYLYSVGGLFRVGATILDVSSGKYAPLATISRAGHYSKLVDLGGAVNVTGVVTNPASNGVSVTYKAAGSNGVFGSSALVSAISGTGGCLGTTTNTRYLWVLVTLDDSYGQGTGGTFPDVNGVATPSKNANLTDFTVNYNPVHPPPNIRLRTGQTLQQGNLSALDTCYP